MSGCCVKFCRSRYSPEKVSLFSFPENEELRAKWFRAIPLCPFDVSSLRVCEKHFGQDQITKIWELSDENMIELTLLTEGAVPCVFPKADYIIKVTREPTRKVANEVSLVSTTNNTTNRSTCFLTTLALNENTVASLKSKYCPEEIFTQIFENPTIVLYSLNDWECKLFDGECQYVTFYTVIPYHDGTPGFLLEKQISFEKDMVIKCKISNKFYDLKTIGLKVPNKPSVESIINILQQLNNFTVCIGGPIIHQHSGFHNNMAIVELKGRVRDKKCSYLLECNGTGRKVLCVHCANLRKGLFMIRKPMLEGERIMLQLQPVKKNQLNNTIKKKLLNAKRRVEMLQNELRTAKDDLSRLSYDSYRRYN